MVRFPNHLENVGFPSHLENVAGLQKQNLRPLSQEVKGHLARKIKLLIGSFKRSMIVSIALAEDCPTSLNF